MPTATPPAVLQVSGLTVRRAGRTIVNDMSLGAPASAVTVLLGPNGAGKTTLLRCCTGLMAPSSGSVTYWQGGDLSPDQACASGVVGLMPQSTGSWSGIKAGELLRHLARLHHDPLDLAPLITRLGLDDALGTSYRRLSGGQQQAVNLLGAIVGRPAVLFLDEPTAGMDPRVRRTTWTIIESLAAAGVAIVLTTHDMAEAAALGRTITIMDRGVTRRHGTIAELTAQGDSLEEVFLAATEADGERTG